MAGERILIVEDENIVARDIQATLQRMGYAVAGIAASGEEAVDAARTMSPDIILMDIVLARGFIDGVETAEKLRQLGADVPVIFLTAHSDDATVRRATSTGPHGYVVKPYQPRDLKIAIDMSLHRLREQEATKAEFSRQIELVEREKRVLERYFPENLVDFLVDNEHSDELRGKNVEATIMFCDLRNSTRIAESMNATSFARLLSEVFSGIMDLTYANGGSVNKLMGDGLLITFGCPFPDPTDTLNCVKLALQVREFLRAFNANRTDSDDPILSMGIGICSGTVFAGNIGSERHMDYTVLGDPVNTASRLEGLTKLVSYDILIDRATNEKVHNDIQSIYAGSFPVRGKKEPVDVFCPVGMT